MRKLQVFHAKWLLLAACLLALGGLTTGTSRADGSDIAGIDFVASEPTSYDHDFGGGAFDDDTSNVDTVESLEGGEFACGDTISYLTEIVSEATAPPDQTVRLGFSFGADTTGQSGAGFVGLDEVAVNYSPIVDLLEDNIEDGMNDDGGSSIINLTAVLSGNQFDGGEWLVTFDVDDIDTGETIIVRIDMVSGCAPDATPTGNVQALLDTAHVVAENGVPIEPDPIPGAGAQTISLKKLEDAAGVGEPLLRLIKTVTTEFGTCPGVDLLQVEAGETVTYCYEVRNDGTADAYDLMLIDDNATPLDLLDDFEVTLAPLQDLDLEGDRGDLEASGVAYGTAQVAIPGDAGDTVRTNIATVTGEDVDGNPLSDEDDATVIISVAAAVSLSSFGTQSAAWAAVLALAFFGVAATGTMALLRRRR